MDNLSASSYTRVTNLQFKHGPVLCFKLIGIFGLLSFL